MFVLPDELPATAAELDVLRDQAQREINVIQARHAANEELTPDDVDRLEYLLDSVDAISAASAEAHIAEQSHRDSINALMDRASTATAPAATTPEGDGDGGEDATEDESEEVPVEGELVTAGVGEPVAASGQRVVNFNNLGNATPPARNENLGWEMYPDSPGFTPGKVDFRTIALGIDSVKPGARSNRRPTGTKGSFSTQKIAHLDRDLPLIQDSHALVDEIERVTREVPGHGKVTAQALTAAGGWCAPSEQLYDFCDVPDAVDLISVPEITVRRGGVRWPREPDVSALLADYAFQFFFTETELQAEDVDGTPLAVKQCIDIPCADEFDEIRLSVVGYCVESGILQEQGWPELTEWFLKTFAAAHLRGISYRTITEMVAGSGTPIVIPPASTVGATSSVLNSLAIMATNLRLSKGLGRDAAIEGVAPSWFAEVIRADLAMGQGVDTKAITDAQINGWLAARNISLQYVADWQARSSGLPGDLATTEWPATVNILLYQAGTWFRALQPVIDLGAMYPKEQLQVNRYTRFFTEDAIAVGKRCNASINVEIPLCVSGAYGAQVAVACATTGP